MKIEQIAKTLAPVFLVVGLLANVDSYIPGFSIPGAAIDYFAAAIACALVAK
jgi:hypothetical protein